MDENRRNFLAAFMASAPGWEAVTKIDDSIAGRQEWMKAREIYNAYMESYVANMPEIMPMLTQDPDSIHMRMVSAHAVAVATVLAKVA
jgi:hypothetical protein